MLHKELWSEFFQKLWGTFRKITNSQIWSTIASAFLQPLYNPLCIAFPYKKMSKIKNTLRFHSDASLIQEDFHHLCSDNDVASNFSQPCQLLKWCNIPEHDISTVWETSVIYKALFFGTTYMHQLSPLLCLCHLKKFSMYLGKHQSLPSSSSVVHFPGI